MGGLLWCNSAEIQAVVATDLSVGAATGGVDRTDEEEAQPYSKLCGVGATGGGSNAGADANTGAGAGARALASLQVATATSSTASTFVVECFH